MPQVTKKRLAKVPARLKKLLDARPFAFHELARLCRNPKHKLLGNTGEILKENQVLNPHGKPRRAVRIHMRASVVSDNSHRLHVINLIEHD